jgi:hypothetical protein
MFLPGNELLFRVITALGRVYTDINSLEINFGVSTLLATQTLLVCNCAVTSRV